MPVLIGYMVSVSTNRIYGPYKNMRMVSERTSAYLTDVFFRLKVSMMSVSDGTM